MEIEITVVVNISLNNDQEPSEALKVRMHRSAREAVSLALNRAEDNGFAHAMEDSTSVKYLGVLKSNIV